MFDGWDVRLVYEPRAGTPLASDSDASPLPPVSNAQTTTQIVVFFSGFGHLSQDTGG